MANEPTSFAFSLLALVADSVGNRFDDNWESRRALHPPTRSVPVGVDEPGLARLGYAFVGDIRSRAKALLDLLAPILPGLERTYGLLADAASRDLMVRLFAYRLLGHTRFRLPLPTADYHARIAALERLAEPGSERVAKVPAKELLLQTIELDPIGIPIRLCSTPLAVYNIFVAEQYAHRAPGAVIAARPGSTVLDVGACWGDTALYFAHEVGPAGEVLALEFLPQNLDILSDNLAWNPSLSERIRVVPRAAWSRSAETMYFTDHGPATQVVADRSDACPLEVVTLALDDLVEEEQIQVGFLKMDIEGAELEALRGAERTLRRQRPELAISVYHRPQDFAEIPGYLASLDLGYRFYLGHATIFESETVLFAGVPGTRVLRAGSPRTIRSSASSSPRSIAASASRLARSRPRVTTAATRPARR